MKMKLALMVVLVAAAVGCTSGGGSESAGEATGAAAAEATGAPAAEATGAPAAEATGAPAAEATGAPAAEATGAAAEEADSLANGVYTSPRFNVRFNLPEGWTKVEQAAGDAAAGPAGLGTSDDSITFVGPAESGLRLVVANTDSIQLVDASFNNLTESIGFENVRIHPDRTQTRTFNGVPGYRTEADALLRGDAVPVYLIAQALELPGKPTMFTLFVPGDLYHIHSATMFAVLDSIQAINLRGN